MKKANYALSVILIAFSAYLIYEATGLQIVDPNDVGPAFFPILIAALMALLAIMLAVQTAMGKGPENKKQDGVEQVQFFSKAQFKPYLTMLLLLIYIFVMNRVGFIVTTAIFTFVLICMFYGNSLKRTDILTALAVSVTGTVLIYIVFHSLLKVPLPAGIMI